MSSNPVVDVGTADRALEPSALDTLFRTARSYNSWRQDGVDDSVLHRIYDLLKWGPTSANCFPARIVFVRSPAAKRRLSELVFERNVHKVATAPVTAILGYDTRYFELMPRWFPHSPEIAAQFAAEPQLAHDTAFRNASLQGAYFMIAARALGLDCGPLSGFDNQAVDREFFPDGRIRSNFLCALGYGDPAALWPRLPRPDFAEVCSLI